MNRAIQRSLLTGAGIAAIGVAGIASAGIVSAATTTNPTSTATIVDKIALKFNLNKDDVQKVFDEEHAARQTERQQTVKDRLAQAVKDGKLTQAQADHITTALAEIQTLMGTTKPGSLDDATKQKLQDKRNALRSWAKENNVDLSYIRDGGMRGGKMMGHGMGMRMHDSDDSTKSSTSTN